MSTNFGGMPQHTAIEIRNHIVNITIFIAHSGFFPDGEGRRGEVSHCGGDAADCGSVPV